MGLGFRVLSFGFRVLGFGFRVLGLGFGFATETDTMPNVTTGATTNTYFTGTKTLMLNENEPLQAIPLFFPSQDPKPLNPKLLNP